jgi:DeoR/GlpR family transcriptional regulator of sugar metabolism
VADSSKCGRVGSVVIGTPECVDEIITGGGVPEECVRALRERGVTVTVAEP